MATEQFRHQLRKEAAQWRTEGLINADQFTQLAERYGFETLETSARDRFIVILIGLGSLLLGLGVITFVAANWQAIPRSFKLAILLTSFLGTTLAGYWLWRRPLGQPGDRQTWQNRLGTGLLLLGSLLMGASLALGAQLFHLGGEVYGLYWLWGIGVLMMALGLGIVPLGLLAMLLLGLAYWFGLFSVERWGGLPGLSATFHLMPLFAATVYTWLAYRCQSRLLFGLGAIALISSFFVSVSQLADRWPDAPGFMAPLVVCLPAALLWSFDDHLWEAIARRPLALPYRFKTVAQGFATFYWVVCLYWFSFHGIWEITGDSPAFSSQLAYWFGAGRELWLNPNMLGLLLVTLVGWVFLARPTPIRPRWHLTTADALILLNFAVLGFLLFWHLGAYSIATLATFLVNVLLALMGASFIRQGLAQANRSLFWCGLLTLSLQILSRMLEYDTGLLLKSFAFVLCGIGVIAIGLWFERYVRTLNRSTPLGEEHP